MNYFLTRSLRTINQLQPKRYAIKISYTSKRYFQLGRPDYPRGIPRINPQTSTSGETLIKDDLPWSAYVKNSVKKDSLENYITTSFGHVRVDSENLPKYHGQQDEYDKESEEALGNHPNSLLRDLDNAKTHEVVGTSKEILLPQSSNSSQTSKVDSDNQSEDTDWFKPTMIHFNDHSRDVYSTTNAYVQKKVLAIEHVNVETTPDKSTDNYIDEYYFGQQLHTSDNYTNSIIEPEKIPNKESDKDKLNEIDQQYFSKLSSSYVESKSSLAKDAPQEMKQVQLDDVIADKDDCLNFIDQQLFGGDKSHPVNTMSSFPSKKSKQKSKPKNVEQKSTALDYVKKMRKNFKFKPQDHSSRKYTKEQEVSRLGESLQSRMGKVVMGNNRDESKKENMSDSDGSPVENTSGQVSSKYLPIDLEALTTVEVEEILKRSVIYDSNDIVAIHKPYGLQMFGKSKRSRHSVESLLSCLNDTLNVKPTDEWSGLLPVHRLDKNTTGILLCAKSKEMHHKLTNLFRQRKIEKRYWAILNGTPDVEQAIIDIPLGSIELKGRHRLTLRPDYTNSNVTNKKNINCEILPAVTEYSVIKTKGNSALVEAMPKSGFKHQIRAHLGLGLNTPILGDHKYSRVAELGKPQKVHGDILHKLEVRKSRSRDLPICLHAKRILIPEIINDGHIEIDCSLPHHFVKIMKKLGLKPSSYVR